MSCRRCGRALAYPGAVFCGSACTARWEAHDRGQVGGMWLAVLQDIRRSFVGFDILFEDGPAAPGALTRSRVQSACDGFLARRAAENGVEIGGWGVRVEWPENPGGVVTILALDPQGVEWSIPTLAGE